MTEIITKINGQQTNELARFKVLAELKSREYKIIAESRPLIIRSPNGVEFRLGVHGQRKMDAWPTHNPPCVP
jgi:hypothetical protein